MSCVQIYGFGKSYHQVDNSCMWPESLQDNDFEKILNDLERASCTMNFIVVLEVCSIWREVFSYVLIVGMIINVQCSCYSSTFSGIWRRL